MVYNTEQGVFHFIIPQNEPRKWLVLKILSLVSIGIGIMVFKLLTTTAVRGNVLCDVTINFSFA